MMLIVTVTQQRSGSKFFCSVLRRQFGLIVLGEVFNPDSLASYSYRQFLLAKGFERALREGTESTLNQYFAGFSDLGGVLQLDVMFNQLEWLSMGWNPFAYESLYGYLRSRDAVVLSLVRNALDVFLSEKTLQISGIPHLFDQNGNPKSTCDIAAEKLGGRRVHLDPAEYASFAESLSIRRRRLSQAFSGYRFFSEINYESLASAVSIDAATFDLIRDAAKRHSIPQRSDGSPVTNVAPLRVPPEYDRLFENLGDLRQIDCDPLP
jgi:hypothetical protein